jgi:hypothetical protein
MQAVGEHGVLIGALERAVEALQPEAAPALLGALARLQGLVLARMLTPAGRNRNLADEGPDHELPAQSVDWLSTDAVTTRFGLTRRWLEDHRPDLRRRHIISKPSRKTTLYHTRRLTRFLEERSRP